MLRDHSIVNITEDMRKYAAEQGMDEAEALKRAMQEKSKEFVEKGAEVYAQAPQENCNPFIDSGCAQDSLTSWDSFSPRP